MTQAATRNSADFSISARTAVVHAVEISGSFSKLAFGYLWSAHKGIVPSEDGVDGGSSQIAAIAEVWGRRLFVLELAPMRRS